MAAQSGFEFVGGYMYSLYAFQTVRVLQYLLWYCWYICKLWKWITLYQQMRNDHFRSTKWISVHANYCNAIVWWHSFSYPCYQSKPIVSTPTNHFNHSRQNMGWKDHSLNRNHTYNYHKHIHIPTPGYQCMKITVKRTIAWRHPFSYLCSNQSVGTKCTYKHKLCAQC
jgi:hypothetical protein